MAATLSSSPGECKVLIFIIFLGICYCCFCGGFVILTNFLLCVKVVAIAVFMALGFAFYVFFAPFVGKKMYQYVVMGLYTPLVTQS